MNDIRCAVTRRGFLGAAASLGAALGVEARADQRARGRRRLVIDCTDLYHPPQDPGDNVDIIAPYALPEIELLAVVLDVTEQYRNDVPRDPGFIPITQLNRIFGRHVPCGVTPFRPMRDPYDDGRDAPEFEQGGIELMLDCLRNAPEPVDILSFGSTKPVALAYNRAPDLMLDKVRLVHVCAGSSEPGFLEWNVVLDPYAFIRVLRSRLPLAIYPCATAGGPFAYGPNNCFWLLPDLQWIRDLAPPLRQYLLYAFTNCQRTDFLRYLEEAPDAAALDAVCARPHNVWETCLWAQVADRRIVRRADGSHRIVPAGDVLPDDTVLPNDLVPCEIEVDDGAEMRWHPTDRPARTLMYYRGDPHENERALREAMPALYRSFRP
jgi:hypothetical protein